MSHNAKTVSFRSSETCYSSLRGSIFYNVLSLFSSWHATNLSWFPSNYTMYFVLQNHFAVLMRYMRGSTNWSETDYHSIVPVFTWVFTVVCVAQSLVLFVDHSVACSSVCGIWLSLLKLVLCLCCCLFFCLWYLTLPIKTCHMSMQHVFLFHLLSENCDHNC